MARLESKFNSQAKRVKCTCANFCPIFIFLYCNRCHVLKQKMTKYKHSINFVLSTFGFSDDHLLTN